MWESGDSVNIESGRNYCGNWLPHLAPDGNSI